MMRHIGHSISCAALSCVILTPFAVRAAAPPSAEAFGRTPAFSLIAMSPNGRSIAIDQQTSGGSRVVVFDVGDAKPRRIIDTDPSDKLRALAWASDEYLLIEASAAVQLAAETIARTTWEFWRTLAVRVDGGSPRLMLMNDPQRPGLTGARVLASVPEQGSLTMSAWAFAATKYKRAIGTNLADPRRDSGWVSTLFKVDINTGKGKAATRGTPYTLAWLVNPQGEAIARSEWRADTGQFAVLAKNGMRWLRVFESDRGGLSLSGTTADGKAIVGISNQNSDYSKAWAVPIDGSEPSVIFELAGRDVTDAISDPYSGVVVGFRSGGARPSQHWIEPARAEQQEALEKMFPARDVFVMQRSIDGKRVLTRVESPNHPPIYYLVDFERSQAETVGDAYPGLAETRMGEVRVIDYAARDGTRVPAYLTLPPGAGEKDLPLIVMPHGGPEARDEFGFDWWSQFLATRGYAILRPQFRGSTGFGQAHRLAGYRQWGGRMQDDVTDGVRFLIKEGIADPARVCILGASYGGYSALAGAAFTPDLYACAISVNGVSDLPAMISHTSSRSGEQSDVLAYWNEHIGPATDPRLASASPARSAQSIEAPVLLVHGVDDTVVPVSQSETMARALDEAGKAYAFVKLPGEDHWLSRGSTRTRVLQEIEAFLSTQLARESASAPEDAHDTD
jgi:dipeptidyl aminopeptidase/acylaminoacyl peptidase